MLSARAIAAASLIAAAWASCPNQCSGHGRCGDFDRCLCFRQQGLSSPYRFGFTGPDCSLRACPLGKSYDRITSNIPSLSPIVFKKSAPAGVSKDKLQATFIPAAQDQSFRDLKRSQKFVVRISTVSQSNSQYGTFAWRFEEDEYYSSEYAIENFMGSTTALELKRDSTVGSSGVYVYWDKSKNSQDGATDDFTLTRSLISPGDAYEFTLEFNEGEAFDSSNSNTAHQLAECSGRGTCEYATGKCTCMPGYSGEACQRTTCPNMCSGHGSCQTQLRFATEGMAANAVAYTAYDREQQYGCKCDGGFRGADCAQVECPSGADPLLADGGAEGMDCSGRGLCDYTSGECKCFKGYYGERCESQTTLV
jgi:hypothetical protein